VSTGHDTGATRDTGAALYLSHDGLRDLVAALVAEHTAVIGPAAAGGPAIPGLEDRERPTAKGFYGELEYREVREAGELVLGPGMPRLSLKQFFLPQSEDLFSWRQRGTDVELTETPTRFNPRVVLGAKPCDAAALEIVDEVMNWEYQDELWNGRREATAIFALACGVEDQHCFCPSMGVAPDSVRGADGLLTPVEGGFVVEATSPKGEAFVAAHRARLAAAPDGAADAARAFRAAAADRVAGNAQIDAARVQDWIEHHFEDPFWATLGVRCNGCGACTMVCPTCHCFDIVDEEEGVGCGTRRRCWDTCQAGKFTVHASGHNPRADQIARYRQRINHKFNVYPLKFGDVLCTGCGRCVRTCQMGQNIGEILVAIDEYAQATADGRGIRGDAAPDPDAAFRAQPVDEVGT
jgi:ferredoxin